MKNPNKMIHELVGFGFGPIQAGLFAAEARASGMFSEITVAEVDAALVDAMREQNGNYAVNIAGPTGVRIQRIEDVHLLNPRDPEDLATLRERLGRATEIVTSLPSVGIYGIGGETSPATLIAEALLSQQAPPTLIYTAENNNHAAEILEDRAHSAIPGTECARPAQFLNTVIGKMSQVVTDPAEIDRRGLQPIVPGFPRAFLVEEFNNIQVSKCRMSDMQPGIRVFEEKENLLPFEEAKLYGHNAIHALLGFLGTERGLNSIPELARYPEIMKIARNAFIHETGAALLRRHADLDENLFTPDGFRRYAGDLLQRITNPHLDDATARAIRDPKRKLGYSDRIFGAIRLCLEYGIQPRSLAAGARAGLFLLINNPEQYALPDNLRPGINSSLHHPPYLRHVLDWLWQDETTSPAEIRRIIDLLAEPHLSTHL